MPYERMACARRPDDCRRSDISEFWQENYKRLVRTANLIAPGGQSDAEDLLSRAIVKVLNYRANGEEIENIAGLLLLALKQVHLDSRQSTCERILSNACAYDEGLENAHVSHHHREREEELYAKQVLEEVFDMVGSLSPQYQSLFRMRFLQELSFAEISRYLGVSEVNARQKVRDMRKKLTPLKEEYFR